MSELSKAIQPVMAEPKQIAPSSNFLLGHHPQVHIAFVNAQVTSQRRPEAQTLYSEWTCQKTSGHVFKNEQSITTKLCINLQICERGLILNTGHQNTQEVGKNKRNTN